MYKLLYSLHQTGAMCSKWIYFIKSFVDDIGLSYVWNSQSVIEKNNIKSYFKQLLCDQFVQKWPSDVEQTSRGQFYLSFKVNFGIEQYLVKRFIHL